MTILQALDRYYERMAARGKRKRAVILELRSVSPSCSLETANRSTE